MSGCVGVRVCVCACMCMCVCWVHACSDERGEPGECFIPHKAMLHSLPTYFEGQFVIVAVHLPYLKSFLASLSLNHGLLPA